MAIDNFFVCTSYKKGTGIIWGGKHKRLVPHPPCEALNSLLKALCHDIAKCPEVVIASKFKCSIR